MKGYETPKLIVCALKAEDVVTASSNVLSKYDDFGNWNYDWEDYLGGDA